MKKYGEHEIEYKIIPYYLEEIKIEDKKSMYKLLKNSTVFFK